MSEQLVMATKKQRHGAYPACVYHQRQKSPPSAPFRQGTTLSSVRVASPLEPFSPVRTGQRAIRLFLLPCRTCGVAAPVGLPSQPNTCNLTKPVAAVEYSCCPFMTLQIKIS